MLPSHSRLLTGGTSMPRLLAEQACQPPARSGPKPPLLAHPRQPRDSHPHHRERTSGPERMQVQKTQPPTKHDRMGGWGSRTQVQISCRKSHFLTTYGWEKKEESVSCSVMSNSLRPVDCSPPGSSVRGILQAKILEWVAIPVSRESSWLRDRT